MEPAPELPAPELIDAIYRDKVLRARNAPPERKLLAPARLYEHARSISLAGIRHQHPDASEENVRDLFRRRLKIARQLENCS